MAEFNHIIDGEIQRLEGATPPPVVTPSAPPTHQRRLSPWARQQMIRIDPASSAAAASATIPPRTAPSSSLSVASVASNSVLDIKKLTADIDTAERQILNDLDHITLTLNSQQQQQEKEEKKKETKTTATTMTKVQPSAASSSSSSTPAATAASLYKPLSSPLLVRIT